MSEPVQSGVDRICANCGQVVAEDRPRLCDHCGLPFAKKVEGRPPNLCPRCDRPAFMSPEPPFDYHCGNCGNVFKEPANTTPDTASPRTTMVRTYVGKQSDATAAFRSDAVTLDRQGWAPVAQSWAGGEWSGGAFLVALLLCVVLIGILVFIYLLVVKPEGTLTVTYQRRLEPVPAARVVATPAPPAVIASPGPNIEERLATLERLRAAGTVTEDEFAARRNKILDEI